MPFLSIIIPVYNKEAYIEDCVHSILNQTFTDFELILVNDGSTDNSGSKCRQLKTEDDRIIVINQSNAGASAARNAGLKAATGRYIGFIDSDDTIESDMYQLLVNNALHYDADISVCRLKVIFPNKIVGPTESRGAVLLNHDEALSACLKGDLDRSANNKIYKAAIAQQIEFEGRIYEDIFYTCKAFIQAQTTIFENVVKYNYIVRDNSVSMSTFNPKYIETIDVSGKMVEMVSAHSKKCIPEAQAFDIVANISLLNLLLLAEKNKYMASYKRVVSTLKKYRPFINLSAGLASKHKYAFKLFSVSPKLYTWLMYLYCIATGAEVTKRVKKAAA
jgi:glycosyltransferase involved in cell wall biosynthesis